MKLKSNLLGIAMAAAMISGSAIAVPTLTVPGGQVLDPFGGFDWASNGTAFTTNFNSALAVAGTPFAFDITYFAYARGTTGILDPGGVAYTVNNLFGGAPGSGSNPFELTTLVTINETATCFGGGTLCTFSTNSGVFDVYLGTGAFLDAQTGAGAALSQYTNGDHLLGGTLSTGASGTFTAIPPSSGFGVTALQGVVGFTNSTYINPDLWGTTPNRDPSASGIT